MTVRVTHVSGRFVDSKKASLRRSVGTVVSKYFDAAFLTGDYPRSDFDGAFEPFSKGAAAKARKDRNLLTTARLGPSTEAVAITQKEASLSMLAARGAVAGVTAQIRLVYVVDRGDRDGTRVTISGRLLLTREKSGDWQIFGYDVARSAVPDKQGEDR
ncbi:MAG: hypothetical protein M3393_04150 [Actinomycetota bacterium]|nr:hypothetical protein [Actinomycetota bacterium]